MPRTRVRVGASKDHFYERMGFLVHVDLLCAKPQYHKTACDTMLCTMQKLEEVYKNLQHKKKEKAEIVKMFRDELTQKERYAEIAEEMKKLREEKKGIEQEIKAGAPKEYDRLEELKVDIAADQELLADIALNMYAKEETVEIVDEHDQAWYPQFRVAFKRL